MPKKVIVSFNTEEKEEKVRAEIEKIFQNLKTTKKDYIIIDEKKSLKTISTPNGLIRVVRDCVIKAPKKEVYSEADLLLWLIMLAITSRLHPETQKAISHLLIYPKEIMKNNLSVLVENDGVSIALNEKILNKRLETLLTIITQIGYVDCVIKGASGETVNIENHIRNLKGEFYKRVMM